MTPYDILGVSPDASIDEIDAAYRERAQRYHPDKGGDGWAFKQLQNAYEEIKNSRASFESVESPRTGPPDNPHETKATGIHAWTKAEQVGGLLFVIFMGVCWWHWVWRLSMIAAGMAAICLAYQYMLNDASHRNLGGAGKWLGVAVVSLLAFLTIRFTLTTDWSGGTTASKAVPHAKAQTTKPTTVKKHSQPDDSLWFWPFTATFPFIDYYKVGRLVVLVVAYAIFDTLRGYVFGRSTASGQNPKQ